MSGDFYSAYKNYLERYIYEGAPESVLLEAYQHLPHYLEESEAQAANILDVHTRALREVMGIRRDNDNVQWIYIERATEFLAQLLIVVDSVLLHLREKVERDSLTGLYNRLGLQRLLTQMLEASRKRKEPLVVALLDLDNFKQINDMYGHQAGDDVLCFVARLITRTLRSDDVVARLGGEEFVIILPATDFAKARVPLERIRAQIAAEDALPGLKGLTVSIGVAEYSGRGSVDPEELLRQADQAMYRAKRLGKNRIVFFGEGEGDNL